MHLPWVTVIFCHQKWFAYSVTHTENIHNGAEKGKEICSDEHLYNAFYGVKQQQYNMWMYHQHHA